MNKHHQWLASQIPLWVSENIISEHQAQALHDRYPVTDGMGLGRVLLTAAGAIMIGLGVILLFAYNWAEMGKYLKLAVIFTALIGTHSLALLTIQRNSLLSEGLFVLATMLMGSAIFLIGQIYHLDSHYPDAFLLWSAGALALAWARPSLAQAFIAIILVLSWHTMEVFDFNYSNHSAFLIILIGVFPLIWRLDSPLLARFVSASLFITLGLSISAENESLVAVTLLMVSACLIQLEQIAGQRGHHANKTIAGELSKPAMLVLISLLLLMTFRKLFQEFIDFELGDSFSSRLFWITLVLSQSGFIWLAVKRRLSAIMMLAELTVLLVLTPGLLINYVDDKTLQTINAWVPMGFNLILLGTSVWLMAGGARQANRRRLLYGCILFAILAMARYTDLFDSLLARAVVFLIVGIALFAVGNVYQRSKKEVKP